MRSVSILPTIESSVLVQSLAYVVRSSVNLFDELISPMRKLTHGEVGDSVLFSFTYHVNEKLPLFFLPYLKVLVTR